MATLRSGLVLGSASPVVATLLKPSAAAAPLCSLVEFCRKQDENQSNFVREANV